MGSAERLIEIFNEASACATEAERQRFVAEACGDDAGLKQQVLSLLQVDDRAGYFLQSTPFVSSTFVITEKPGDRIGRYKLLEQIGEGGCGVVYMAEQEEPVRRRVALKVIKLGMDTKQVIARFEAERQALALMDHPNIAKIFDAGITDTPLPASGHPLPSSDEGRGQGEGSSPATRHPPLATHYGRPFFVMELVRGIKITEYCDQNNLSTNERLELFIQVCQAIQHAHQKGIIHRDIKPSNILVTRHDDVAVPKVIDSTRRCSRPLPSSSARPPT
jgi:eukaryotic-like serine/threonine-protein kinase